MKVYRVHLPAIAIKKESKSRKAKLPMLVFQYLLKHWSLAKWKLLLILCNLNHPFIL
jgi:hypothetical protein